MSFFEDIKGAADALRYPETWVTRAALLPILGVTSILSEGILTLLRVPSIHQLWTTASAMVISFLIWFLGREVYWRTGGGRRVGICYDGYKVPLDDWAETRKELAALCASFPPEQRVRLKLVPKTLIGTTDESWAKAEEKYRLPLILMVSKSPRLDDPAKTSFRVRFRAKFSAELRTDFIRASHEHAAVLCSTKPPSDLQEALKLQAESVFDLIIFFLAIIDYSRNQFVEAAVFLKRVDERAAAKQLPTATHPRKAVRWLRCSCLVSPSGFPGDRPPDPDDLVSVTSLCQEAADTYGQEFPYLYNTLARDYFFMRDLDSAMHSSKMALTKPLSGIHLPTAILNRAVLALLADNPKVAAASFAEFFQDRHLSRFDWNDLIKFADFAHDYGYRNAIYIRALYRKYAGKTIPVDMSRRLSEWFNETNDRGDLSTFYWQGLKLPDSKIKIPASPPKRKKKRRGRK